MDMELYLKEEITLKQPDDVFLAEEIRRIKAGQKSEFELGTEDGALRYHGRLCIPNNKEITDLVMREAHNTPYSIHPGSTKMYMDLREIF